MEKQLRIDAHQHFWKYHPVKDVWITEEMKIIKTDFLPYDSLRELEENKMDGCIAVQASQSESENAFLISEADRKDFIKGVVGWVDFGSKYLPERLEFYYKFCKKMKGFRHIVQDEEDDFLLREDFCNGIRQLQQYHFTYDILIYPKQLPAAIRFVEKFPEQKFILDHLAKPLIKEKQTEPWRTHIKEIAQHPNVYCKLSGMVTEANWQHWEREDFFPYLDAATEAFGANRLLFGSDWPVCLVAASYQRTLNIIEAYYHHFSAEDQAAIMGGNAVKFYNL